MTQKQIRPRWTCQRGDDKTPNPGPESVFTWQHLKLLHENGKWVVKNGDLVVVESRSFSGTKRKYRDYVNQNPQQPQQPQQPQPQPQQPQPQPQQPQQQKPRARPMAPNISKYKQLDNLPQIIVEGGDADQRALVVREWMWLRHARHIILEKDPELEVLQDFDLWKDLLKDDIPPADMDYMTWQRQADSPQITDIEAVIARAKEALKDIETEEEGDQE